MIILGLVLHFQLQTESLLIHHDWSHNPFPSSTATGQKSVKIKYALKRSSHNSGYQKMPSDFFHCHTKHRSSLHLHTKLNMGRLNRGESRMRTLISIIYPCQVGGESVMSMKSRLLSSSLLTRTQYVTAARFSMLDRRGRFRWHNRAPHNTLVC